MCICVHTYAAKSLQSCPTLCDPIDGSPPGSPVPGILQARTLEWVAISFFNAWKWKVKVKLLSRVQLSETPWTAAHQAPPSMGFFQARVLEWSAIAFYIHIHIHIFIASTLHYICNVISVRMCVTCYLIPLVYLSTFVEISHTLNYRPF